MTNLDTPETNSVMTNDPRPVGEESTADTEASFHERRLLAYRDDGPIAIGIGRAARGQLPPLLPLIVAATVTMVLLVAGVADQTGLVLLIPVLALLLAGPGSTHPHTGRLDWLAPVIIRLMEYGYLAAVGFSHAVPKPLVYALLGILAFHQYDTVYRTRQRIWPAPWVFTAGLGWDGRLLIAGLAAQAHVAWLAYAALTPYLGILYATECVYTWNRSGRRGVAADREEGADPRDIDGEWPDHILR